MSSDKEIKRKLFIGRDNNETPRHIEARGLLAHTAIIGQSGSGKSFLMGRLIEEILLNTKGKMVIFDTNADFIKINNARSKIWEKEKDLAYKNLMRLDYVLDSSFKVFNEAWQNVAKDIHIFGDIGGEKKINISWKELTLNEWCQLLSFDYKTQPEIVYLLSNLITHAKHPKIQWKLEHWLLLPKLIVKWARKHFKELGNSEIYFKESLAKYIAYNFLLPTIQHLANALDNAIRYKILNDESDFQELIKEESFRLLCFNIAYLQEKEARLFAVYHIVKQLWEYSITKRWKAIEAGSEKDERVPIFILIDEVHKIAPEKAETLSEIANLNLIKQIASEGRKFGLFLIVATQRPQKLHKDLLSECDNLCVMHLVNRKDFKKIQENFGFISDEEITFDRLVEFKKGRGFFAGKWVDNKNITMERIAPQRTEPCGGDLREENFETGLFSEQLIEKKAKKS